LECILLFKKMWPKCFEEKHQLHNVIIMKYNNISLSIIVESKYNS